MMASKNNIKIFIDFFHDASLKIRKEKPSFTRGKDGNLVKLALNKLSESQLEMLAVWFLAKKPKLKPTIGAMLSNAVLEELMRKIKDPNFWKELDEIYEKNFPRKVVEQAHYLPRQISLETIKEDKLAFSSGELMGLLFQNDNSKRK